MAISGLYYFANEGKLKSAIEELIKRDIRTNNEYQITDALQIMVKQDIVTEIIKKEGLVGYDLTLIGEQHLVFLKTFVEKMKT